MLFNTEPVPSFLTNPLKLAHAKLLQYCDHKNFDSVNLALHDQHVNLKLEPNQPYIYALEKYLTSNG